VYTVGEGLTLAQSGKQGAIVDFFDSVMKEFGVTTFTIVPISDTAKNYSGSSFTQCCYELALNSTDVCVGNYWQTEQRQFELKVDFTRTVYNEEIRLVTKIASQSKRHFLWPLLVWTMTKDDVDPFSTENILENLRVWSYILGTLLFSALALYVVEGYTNDEMFPERQKVDGISRSIFNQMQGFFGQGDHRYVPHTHAGRFLVMVMSIATLVLLTAYTALMTSAMVVSQSNTGRFDTIQEAVSTGALICGLDSNQQGLIAKFPSVNYLGGLNTYAEVLEAMDDPQAGCEAAVIAADGWLSEQHKECDKMQSPHMVMQFPVAYPVRTDLRAALSWAITRRVDQGEYDKISRDWIARTVAPRSCAVLPSEQQDASELVAFPLLICILSSLLTLLMYGVQDFLSHRIAKANLEPGSLASILRPPSLYERFIGPLHSKKDEIPPAASCDNKDMEVLAGMIQARHLTIDRTNHMLKSDAPLTLADVPMLLSLISQTAPHVASPAAKTSAA
jgi:hypothetical protein